MKINLLFTNASLVALLIAGISAAALAGAYIFEYGFGLQPCMLCLYQRVPHFLEVLIGGTAFFVAWKVKKPKKAALLVFLAALLYFGEAGLAFYHTGVEHHWWESFLEACTHPLATNSPQDLLHEIERAKSVRCDAVPWQMFGISMAGYNALLSLGMAIYSLLASIFITRKANGF